MLSMKHKLQLMQFVQDYNSQCTVPTLIADAEEYLSAHNNDQKISVTTADLKEACKNADMKWSAICSTGTSPVALLHIKVAELIAARAELTTQINELRIALSSMKSDLNDMKQQVRTMKETLSPLRLVQP